MFSSKLNKYLKIQNCSAKTLSAMTNISESTISRYRSGKTIPTIESGNIECIATALAELPGTTTKQQDLYEELMIAAYEDLGLIDYNVFASKLNTLIDNLKITKRKLADAIHLSPSFLSKICNGQTKPNKPADIAENVALYISKNYSQENYRILVQQLIWGSIVGYGRFFSTNDYFICLKKWLLTGKRGGNDLTDHLLRKHEKYDISNFIPYSKNLQNDTFKYTYAFRNNDHQVFTGKDGLEKAFFAWINSTCASNEEDECFLFDDLFSDIARTDYKLFYKYTITIEKLIKSGKKITFVHNLNNDIYKTTLKLLVWLPLTLSKQVQNYYLNEPASNIFKNVLLVSSEVVMFGYTVNNDYEHGYYYLCKSSQEITKAQQQASRILKNAEASNFIYNNRQDYVNNLMYYINSLNSNKKITVYLPSPPLSTIDEQLLIKIIQKNNISPIALEHILNQYHKECQIRDHIIKNHSLDIFIDYKDSDRWHVEPVFLYLNYEGQEYMLSYDYDEYLQHFESTKAYAQANGNIQLNVKNMNFYKNLLFIYIPDLYVSSITFDDRPVAAGSTQKPIIDAIEKLLYIVNPMNEAEVLKNSKEKEILYIYKRLTSR